MKDSLESKIGYLKGLLENPEFQSDSAGNTLARTLVDVLDLLSTRLLHNEESYLELSAFVDDLDDELEDYIRSDEDEDDYDFEEDDDFESDQVEGPGSGQRGLLHFVKDDKASPVRPFETQDRPDQESSDPYLVRVAICPKCHKIFYIRPEEKSPTLICPFCSAKVSPIIQDPATFPMGTSPVD